MIFVSSDFHLCHANVIRFDGRPDHDVESMNRRIIGSVNEHVGENDALVYLGDFLLDRSIGRNDNAAYVAKVRSFLEQLRTKEVIFVAGNHDRTWLKRNGCYEENMRFWALFHGFHPMGSELRITKRVCAEHGIPSEFQGMLVAFTHYAMRVWNRSHKSRNDAIGASINLHGHSHGKLPGIRNALDVSFNVWNRPLSLAEILADLMPKHNLEVAKDHEFIPTQHRE